MLNHIINTSTPSALKVNSKGKLLTHTTGDVTVDGRVTVAEYQDGCSSATPSLLKVDEDGKLLTNTTGDVTVSGDVKVTGKVFVAECRTKCGGKTWKSLEINSDGELLSNTSGSVVKVEPKEEEGLLVKLKCAEGVVCPEFKGIVRQDEKDSWDVTLTANPVTGKDGSDEHPNFDTPKNAVRRRTEVSKLKSGKEGKHIGPAAVRVVGVCPDSDEVEVKTNLDAACMGECDIEEEEDHDEWIRRRKEARSAGIRGKAAIRVDQRKWDMWNTHDIYLNQKFRSVINGRKTINTRPCKNTERHVENILDFSMLREFLNAKWKEFLKKVKKITSDSGRGGDGNTHEGPTLFSDITSGESEKVLKTLYIKVLGPYSEYGLREHYPYGIPVLNPSHLDEGPGQPGAPVGIGDTADSADGEIRTGKTRFTYGDVVEIKRKSIRDRLAVIVGVPGDKYDSLSDDQLYRTFGATGLYLRLKPTDGIAPDDSDSTGEGLKGAEYIISYMDGVTYSERVNVDKIIYQGQNIFGISYHPDKNNMGQVPNDWSGWTTVKDADWSNVNSFSLSAEGGNEPDGRKTINVNTLIDKLENAKLDPDWDERTDALEMSRFKNFFNLIKDNSVNKETGRPFNPFESVVYECRIQVKCDDAADCRWITLIQEKLGIKPVVNNFKNFLYKTIRIQVRTRIYRGYEHFMQSDNFVINSLEESYATRDDGKNIKIIVATEKQLEQAACVSDED